MKKVILAVTLIMVSPAFATAQDIKGGFGHAYFGPAFSIATGTQHDLRASAILGNDLHLNRIAISGGGGGYGVFGKKFLIGGSGTGYRVADETPRGEATLSTGGGFVNIGYIVGVLDNMIISYPYFGFGGKGMVLTLENKTTDETLHFGNRDVLPGDRLTLTSAGIGLEIGYGLQVLTFSLDGDGRHGGFMLGLQAGTYLFAGLDDWREQSSNERVGSLSEPYCVSPYVRITIGGGALRIRNDD